MNFDLIDVHTHLPAPKPEAIISVSPEEFNPIGGQSYSVGIHPWKTSDGVPEEMWRRFEEAARHPQVVAIGECGIDLLKGGPLFRQMLVMKRQIELSEEIGKPLIIHDVKAHDIITGLKRDLNPTRKWMVHGFRYKPTVAKMMTDAGIWLSFGQHFNDAAVAAIPEDMMLAETDGAPVGITDIISSLSAACGKDMTQILRSNASRFLSAVD